MYNTMVSIVCLAYNHEKYIKKALDGFINQKTNFPFEVIVHDDASTDKTTDIIREYEKKYPGIIKGIYQTENQYSKKIKITRRIVLPKVKSKYIAFCEGDDYWNDNNKLQMQYDILEANPNYSMCTHGIIRIKENGDYVSEDLGEEKAYSFEDILFENSPTMHTSSRLIRRDIYASMPEFMTNAPVGDGPMLTWSSMKGDIYYIDKAMSSYRIFSSSSWSKRILIDKKLASEQLEGINRYLKELDEFTDFKYSVEINKKIDYNNFFFYFYHVFNYKNAKRTNSYKRQSLKNKIIINIGCILPGFINHVRKLKNKDRYN